MDSLALLVAKGAYAREELDDLIRRISERLEDERFLLERTERHQWVASVLVNCGPGDLIEIVRGWFAEESGSEDPFLRIVALEEIEDSASHPEMRAGYWYSLQLWDAIEADTYKSLRWMMEEPEDEFEDDFVDEPVFGADPAFRDDDGPTMPLVRIEPKVGRNDPCPCGSGKKYKKCCGAN